MGFFKNYKKLYQSFVTTQSNFSKITKDSNPHLNSIKSRWQIKSAASSVSQIPVDHTFCLGQVMKLC